jgi:hypothetical protein
LPPALRKNSIRPAFVIGAEAPQRPYGTAGVTEGEYPWCWRIVIVTPFKVKQIQTAHCRGAQKYS